MEGHQLTCILRATGNAFTSTILMPGRVAYLYKIKNGGPLITPMIKSESLTQNPPSTLKSEIAIVLGLLDYHLQMPFECKEGTRAPKFAILM